MWLLLVVSPFLMRYVGAQENSPFKTTRAIELVQQGQVDEAYRLFRETLEDNPSRPSFWQNLGLMLGQIAEREVLMARNRVKARRLYQEAAECLEMAGRLDPRLVLAVAEPLLGCRDNLQKLQTAEENNEGMPDEPVVSSEDKESMDSCEPDTETCSVDLDNKMQKKKKKTKKKKLSSVTERERRRRLFEAYESDRSKDTLAKAVQANCAKLEQITVTPPKLDREKGRLGVQTIIEVYEVFRLCGVVLIKGIFEKDFLEEVMSSTQVLLQEYLETIEVAPELTNRSGSNQRSPMRYELKYPLTEPFVDSRLIANRAVLALCNAALSSHKYELDTFSHITSLPHSPAQHWHRDVAALFETRPMDLPPHGLVTFVPLHNVTQDMGPTRFAVGTHWAQLYNVPDEPLSKNWPLVDVIADIGDIVALDMRIVHMGGENKSDKRRTMVYLAYVQEWFVDRVNFHDKHTRDFDAFDSRLQKLLSRADGLRYIERLEAALRDKGVSLTEMESEYRFAASHVGA
eukprot:gb/GEZN01005019.1/.p1 GENE.gb/GEZN01005019.1/~~gb/GEZN01005019.1/.p1  ORF type:complete len:524 (+),score=80.69 gb/GEZN01005019.1/:25-1572(+)